MRVIPFEIRDTEVATLVGLGYVSPDRRRTGARMPWALEFCSITWLHLSHGR